MVGLGGVMKLVLFAAVAIVCCSSPVLAADQFNLDCSGTEETFNALEIPPLTTKPYREVFRVDLAKGRYCADDCQGTGEIFEITETRIEFSEPADSDRVRGTHFFYVSRVTGELTNYSRPARSPIAFTVKAECKVTPFSGFPPVERKF